MLDTRIFPPDFRGNYPHMFPGDVEIWERFLDRYGDLYTGFQYDIMCGEECEQFPRWEEEYKKDAAVLSRLRIDAIGHRKDGDIDIIEVKPRAGSAAIGQVLTYKEHYDKENPEIHSRAIIVSGQEDKNIYPVAEKLGVLYFVVAPLPSPTSTEAL